MPTQKPLMMIVPYINRIAKSLFHSDNLSFAEKMVKAALGCNHNERNLMFSRIATMTQHPKMLRQVMAAIWYYLSNVNRKWIHVVNGILLLEYLVLRGNEDVVEYCRRKFLTLEGLNDIKVFAKCGVEATQVCVKHEEVLELVQNDCLLVWRRWETRQEDQKAKLQLYQELLKGI